MIVKDEFLSRLRKIFDLNLYEVKVWTALLSRGTSTAGELSNISDVPRSRTYDILESLDGFDPFKNDIWSLGICIYLFMNNGKFPWEFKDIDELDNGFFQFIKIKLLLL